jgi:hypothetical protein
LLGLLDDVLSPESLLSDQPLDLGGPVEGLVALLDLALDNVLPDVVLFAEGKGLSDVVSSLRSESLGYVDVGESFDLLLSLLLDGELDDSEVGA